jgi:hypothetical protein
MCKTCGGERLIVIHTNVLWSTGAKNIEQRAKRSTEPFYVLASCKKVKKGIY